MAVKLRVFQDGDDALLVWGVPAVIPNCVGFAIRKRQTVDGHSHSTWLPNYVGFAGETHTAGETKPSTQWPFQEFLWTDHSVEQGDLASYRVVPVVTADGKLELDEGRASAWSDTADISSLERSTRRVYFNRGFFMSQFVARYCAQTNRTPKQLADNLTSADETAIREFLSGDVRVALLRLLADAQTAGGHVYAALFELTDDELIEPLVALGDHAHLVLGNGSADKPTDDENSAARQALIAAHVDVSATERFIAPQALAHNKFLVVCDADGTTPTAVWTGSTNWSITGLCTQLNNAILIDDPVVGQVFLDQWHRLRAAGNGFPAELLAGNVAHDAGDTTVWFTRAGTSKADLAGLTEIVDGAQHGIVFLMFEPGSAGTFADVIKRDGEPNLFVRGVVSDLPAQSSGSKLHVTTVGGGSSVSHSLDVVQPDGVHTTFAFWAAEETRSAFLGSIGHAIVHSKILLIDPLSDDPIVVTGSHNFSLSASADNDENFVIIRGDKPLAEAYLVNVMAAWRHYHFRAGAQDYQGLKSDDSWMAGSLAAHQRDAFFWGV